MSPSASAVQRPDFPGWPLWVVLGGVAILGALYLAGYFLLWSIGESPTQATPLTWYRYWHWYGDLPKVRLRLLFSAAANLAEFGCSPRTCLRAAERSVT